MGVYYRQSDTTCLKRSVESILSQTLADFELLICDDGSVEEAVELLDQLARSDHRIRLIRRGDLVTLPQKLNACLRVSTGKLIARMDDDDWSAPDRFAKQVAALAVHPNIAFVGSNVELWRSGKRVGERRLPLRPTPADFLFVQPFIHPTLMFRAEALKQVGGYSENRFCLLCEDYDLLLRLYAIQCVGMNLEEQLLYYSLPELEKVKRKMRYRINESVTRYRRFRELGMLPRALPYVVKPIAVGLVPTNLLHVLKRKKYNTL